MTASTTRKRSSSQGLGWVGVDMSGGVSTGDPLTCFGNEPGDFVVLDLDIERLVPILAGDPATKLGGTQSMFFWYRGNAAKVLMNEKNWTVETLDQHPSRMPFRPGGKRPSPSGPNFVPTAKPGGRDVPPK